MSYACCQFTKLPLNDTGVLLFTTQSLWYNGNSDLGNNPTKNWRVVKNVLGKADIMPHRLRHHIGHVITRLDSARDFDYNVHFADSQDEVLYMRERCWRCR